MSKNACFVVVFICLNYVNVFAQKNDTLYAKKSFLTTRIYSDSVKLSKKKVTELFHDTWKPRKKYQWSNVLKPVGPLATLGGIGLAYVAMKGVSFATTTEGKQGSYKSISLPQLSIGVGLVVIGYSIIESSKMLAYSSVDVYNLMLKDSKKTTYINKIQFGITESRSVGFSVSLK